MTIELIETRDQLQVLEDSTELIELITQGEQGVGITEGSKGIISIPSNLTDWTLNDNVITSAKIVNGTIVNEDINDNAAIALTKLATGALPTAITVTSANISDLSIVDADISGSAAISLSKLATGALPTGITVTSANISDLSIVNADINASAAIAGTKISPNFGSQNIETTGNATVSRLKIEGANIPKIEFTDADDNPDYSINVNSGQFNIIDATNSANRFRINTNGHIDIAGNLDVGAGLDVTGQITATDNLTITSVAPKIFLVDSDTNDDFSINGDGGTFRIKSETDSANRLVINSDGHTDIIGRLDAQAGIDVTGNISVSGTVDGRDVATDGTKLDGIETGATADQTAAEIKTLLNSNGIVNAQIDASAAIAGSKINPNFGSQALIGSELVLSATQPNIRFTDVDGNPDYLVKVNTGVFDIRDFTSDTSRLSIQSDGHVDIAGNLDVGAGLDVTGNITVTGTVDGVDIAALNTTVGNLSLSGSVLADGTTATTQSAGDNSTKVATTAYADTAVSNLVDSAPSALNTLNELAAALGDDANFSTTVTNSIATKLPLAGGTLTGDLTIETTEPQIFLKDSNNNDDFTIRNTNGVFTIRDSTNAVDRLTIDSNGKGTFTTALDVTGDLTVESTLPQIILKDTNNDDDFTIKNTNGVFTIRDSTNGADRFTINSSGELSATGDTFIGNGSTTTLGTSATFRVANTGSSSAYSTFEAESASGSIRLGNDGTFHVTGNTNIGAGLDVTGNITVADNDKAIFGTGSDLEIYHDGTDSYIQNETNDLFIDNNGDDIVVRTADTIFFQVNNTENTITARANGAVELYFDNSKKFETTSAGVAVTGQLTTTGDITVSSAFPKIYLTAINHNPDWSLINSNGEFKIFSETDSSSRIKIKPNGNVEVLVNLQIPNDTGKLQLGTSQDLELYHDSTDSYITNATGDLNILNTGSNSDDIFIKSADNIFFHVHGTETGMNITGNAAVDLFFDGSKKLETTSSGIDVDGSVTANDIITAGALLHEGDTDTLVHFSAADTIDLKTSGTERLRINNSGVSLFGVLYTNGRNISLGDSGSATDDRITFGESQDLQIYHDGNNSFIENSGTGSLNLYGDEVGILNKARSEFKANFITNGAAELYYDNSKKLETTSTGTLTSGTRAEIKAEGASDEPQLKITSENGAIFLRTAGSSGSFPTGGVGNDGELVYVGGDFRLGSATASKNLMFFAGGYTERLRINSSGNVQIPNDNAKLQIGASQDLELYHDGSHSRIKDTGTGGLILSTDRFQVTNAAVSENLIKGFENAAVELYYDNSKKLETTSTGANVVGELGINKTSPYYNLHLEFNDSTTALSGGTGGNWGGNGIRIENANSTTGAMALAHFRVGDADWHIGSVRSGTNASDFKFLHENTEIITFKNDGNVQIPADNKKLQIGASQDLQIYHDGSHSYIQDTGTGELRFTSNTYKFYNAAFSETLIEAFEDGAVNLYYNNSKKFETTSSGITVTGTVTETSDIALKSNIQPITNSLEKIQQIKGCKYTLNSSVSKSMGVIAQDVEKVFPELVHGSEGNKTLQYSGLIGVLIEAVKDLSDEVAALKAN